MDDLNKNINSDSNIEAQAQACHEQATVAKQQDLQQAQEYHDQA